MTIRKVLLAATVAVAAILTVNTPEPAAIAQPAAKAFPRGAKASPPHKLVSSPRFAVRAAPPAQFAVVPSKLSYWLNNQTGDCVSAESAFHLAWYSTYVTGTEVLVPDAEVGRWAKKYGFYNGAMLTDVMDVQQKDGFTVNGTNYRQGPYFSVDYSNETVLRSAISTGSVNIAIDANALPSGAGNVMGWYATGGRPGQFGNIDHCVGLAGYGPPAYVFGRLGVPVPSGADASKTYYMLFTWNTIGVVDHAWLMSCTAEAWYRNPGIQGMSPPTPPEPPTPPVPPPGANFTGTLTYVNGVLVAVTPGGQPAPGLKAELEAAGVNPAIILDILQLVADVKAKAGFAVILADMMKIIADLHAVTPSGSAVPRGVVPEFALAF